MWFVFVINEANDIISESLCLAMRLDLFSKDDTVLLIGEGNFTFAVCLRNYDLPIEMVATCFEPEIEYENQQENIDYLESHSKLMF